MKISRSVIMIEVNISEDALKLKVISILFYKIKNISRLRSIVALYCTLFMLRHS